MFEWDDSKAAGNIAKHGFAFDLAALIFDGRPCLNIDSVRGEELGFRTVTEVNGRLITAIWTWRGEARRIISIRRAWDHETRNYRALYR